MTRFLLPGVVLALFVLAGCTSTSEKDGAAGSSTDPSASDSGAVPTPDDGTAGTTGTVILAPDEPTYDPDCPPPCEFTRDAVDDPSSLLAQKIIYFDYDRSDMRSDFFDLIAAHGRYLATYADMKVRLEGHADERGTREYNIALGENRSIAVRRQLLLQGVSQDQITIVSYGEELPASLGHDEEAWAQNRRVELIYNQ